MKCPLGHDLTRPSKAAFRQTKVIDGVKYRPMDCRLCYHTFLVAEMVVTPERAAALELMSFSEMWPDAPATPTSGTGTTASSAARLRALSESESFSRLPSTQRAETTPPSSERG